MITIKSAKEMQAIAFERGKIVEKEGDLEIENFINTHIKNEIEKAADRGHIICDVNIRYLCDKIERSWEKVGNTIETALKSKGYVVTLIDDKISIIW